MWVYYYPMRHLYPVIWLTLSHFDNWVYKHVLTLTLWGNKQRTIGTPVVKTSGSHTWVHENLNEQVSGSATERVCYWVSEWVSSLTNPYGRIQQIQPSVALESCPRWAQRNVLSSVPSHCIDDVVYIAYLFPPQMYTPKCLYYNSYAA